MVELFSFPLPLKYEGSGFPLVYVYFTTQYSTEHRGWFLILEVFKFLIFGFPSCAKLLLECFLGVKAAGKMGKRSEYDNSLH